MNKKLFPLIYIKDINSSLNQKSILCLDNYFFHIFKISIENIINEEDRISQIEDRLEIIFPKYNGSDEFILKYEILEKHENSEKLIIYILETSDLKNLNMLDNKSKFQILAIFPSFFLAREYKEASNFYNFDISQANLVISKYSSYHLEDINVFQIDKNLASFSYSNIINTFLENVENNFDIIFTGEEIDFSTLELNNKKYIFFEIKNIGLNNKKYTNFLPKNLRKKYLLYYMNLKYLYLFFVLLISTIFFSIFLYFKISDSEKILSSLELNNSSIENINREIRDEIAELEKSILLLTENEKEKKYNDFKISSLFEELLLLIPKNISIQSLEYDGKKIIALDGFALKLEDINLFIKNIDLSKKIKLENYDYIIKKEKFIEFKVELIFEDL